MDDEDFRAALSQETPRLLRLATRLTPPEVDQEDLFQDVLERAWKSRSGFRQGSKLSTWLHSIMVNRATDLARRSTAAPAQVPDTDPDVYAIDIRDPALVAERAADSAALRAALSRLPPEDRTVLVLGDGEDMKADEVAVLMGISTEAVYKRLQRGRLRLAGELDRATGLPLEERPPETCRQARLHVSAYLDDRLDSTIKVEVDEHLRECSRCPPLVQAVVGLKEALGVHPETEIPPGLSSAVDERARRYG
ncbi:MAG: polymerase sigma-70 factor, subfamily [Actinomycetota bacterium]|nr:polymerase sigma-70 factor, subfamily [Actinomycetota bacterium]